MKSIQVSLISFITLIVCVFACSSAPETVYTAVDRENNRLIVLTGDKTEAINYYDADFVILGGGLGGIAAALSICSSGRTALLIEESDRIAACFSYQDTSLFSENRFVETSGTSKTYQEFRTRIRQWYDEKSLEAPQLYNDMFAGMNDFGADNFCFETEAALKVIDDMLARNVEKGKLTIIKRHKVVDFKTYNNRISSLIAMDMDSLKCNLITGWMIVDATRSGYLLSLTGLDHVRGRESASDTGELHASAEADTLADGLYLYCNMRRTEEDGDDTRQCIVSPLVQGEPADTSGVVMYPLNPLTRRLVAKKRVVEQDIAASSNPGPRARFFKDSVGIGYHPIVLDDGTTIKTKPFQIPLGALVPTVFTNLFAGGRTIGASYIASKAYMAPAVEWAIGEAAGEAAAYCAGYTIFSHELADTPEHVRGLQEWLVTKRGVPIYWYDDVRPTDPDFNDAQLAPFDDPDFHEKRTTLHYHEE